MTKFIFKDIYFYFLVQISVNGIEKFLNGTSFRLQLDIFSTAVTQETNKKKK